MLRKLSITIVAGAVSLGMGVANADSSFVASADEGGPFNNSVVVRYHSRDLGSPFPASAGEGKTLEPYSGGGFAGASIPASANDD